jgi:outer membrane protein
MGLRSITLLFLWLSMVGGTGFASDVVVDTKETKSASSPAADSPATTSPTPVADKPAGDTSRAPSSDINAKDSKESDNATRNDPADPTPPDFENELKSDTSAISAGTKKTLPIHLTLAQSVKIALQTATSVQKAGNDSSLAGKELLQGYGQFLPNLVFVGSYNYNGGNTYYSQSIPTVVSSNNYGPTYQITTTLNLFNGLSDFSQLRAALERKTAAEMTLTRAREQITLDITQSYLQVLLDQHIVQIAQQNLETSQERQRLLREQTKVGVKNFADLFRQEAQTSSDESFLITNQNKLRDDQILLLRKLRLDTEKDYIFEEPDLYKTPVKDDYPPEATLVKTALQNRTDLKAAEATSESAAWNVGVARSTYFPRLDLSFGVFAAGRTYDTLNVNGVYSVPPTQSNAWSQLGNHTNYSVGLTLTWNIFDRFETGLNVARASVNSDNALLDAQDSRIQVVGDIRQAYGDYRGSIQNLNASKIGLQAAEKAYEVTRGRYDVGAASFLDLSTSQVVLVQAQTTRIQAQITYLLQRKLIEFFLGTIPTDGTVEF